MKYNMFLQLYKLNSSLEQMSGTIEDVHSYLYDMSLKIDENENGIDHLQKATSNNTLELRVMRTEMDTVTTDKKRIEYIQVPRMKMQILSMDFDIEDLQAQTNFQIKVSKIFRYIQTAY